MEAQAAVSGLSVTAICEEAEGMTVCPEARPKWPALEGLHFREGR